MRVKRENTVLELTLHKDKIDFCCEDDNLFYLLMHEVKFFNGLVVEHEANTANYTITATQAMLYRTIYYWSTYPYLTLVIK